jgi:hypothetical protein
MAKNNDPVVDIGPVAPMNFTDAAEHWERQNFVSESHSPPPDDPQPPPPPPDMPWLTDPVPATTFEPWGTHPGVPPLAEGVLGGSYPATTFEGFDPEGPGGNDVIDTIWPNSGDDSVDTLLDGAGFEPPLFELPADSSPPFGGQPYEIFSTNVHVPSFEEIGADGFIEVMTQDFLS